MNRAEQHQQLNITNIYAVISIKRNWEQLKVIRFHEKNIENITKSDAKLLVSESEKNNSEL